jgi:uncharacterized protein DUF4232
MLRRSLLAFCVFLMAGCGGSPTATASATDYVPWLPLHTTGVYPLPPSPTPGPAVPIPTGTAVCHAAQLEAVAIGGYAASGGNVDSPVALRNGGSANCYLEGYPDITVLDAAGRSLAQALGSANRGTYFPEWPEGQVLMQPGTPPLPHPSFTGHMDSLSRGQGLLNMEWWDCGQPTAAKLSIDLPNGGGNLTIPYSARAPYYPTCDSYTQPAGTVTRGAFGPAGYWWPPDPAYLKMDIAISAPPSVKHGSTLVYYVTVKNASDTDYLLSPCPDYTEILGAKVAVAGYQLNCAPVRRIAPGANVKFEMRLTIPSSGPIGPNDLMWALKDGRLALPFASTSINVI